jgi:hypothetical protein
MDQIMPPIRTITLSLGALGICWSTYHISFNVLRQNKMTAGIVKMSTVDQLAHLRNTDVTMRSKYRIFEFTPQRVTHLTEISGSNSYTEIPLGITESKIYIPTFGFHFKVIDVANYAPGYQETYPPHELFGSVLPSHRLWQLMKKHKTSWAQQYLPWFTSSSNTIKSLDPPEELDSTPLESYPRFTSNTRNLISTQTELITFTHQQLVDKTGSAALLNNLEVNIALKCHFDHYMVKRSLLTGETIYLHINKIDEIMFVSDSVDAIVRCKYPIIPYVGLLIVTFFLF